MQYIFQNKLTMEPSQDNLDDMTIVVAEPQAETRGLHARALQAAGWTVLTCAAIEGIHQHLSRRPAQALLFNLDLDPSRSLPALRIIRRGWPELSIITTGEIASERQLDQLMQIGIAGHCHTKLLNSRSLALAVQGLLTLTPKR